MNFEAALNLYKENPFFDPESAEWKADESYTVLLGTDSRNAKPVGGISF